MVIPMKTMKTGLLLLVTLAAASAGPLIFPAAQAGYGTMAQSAKSLLLPAVAVLIFIALLSWKSVPEIARSIVWGGLAGDIAAQGRISVGHSVLRLACRPRHGAL